MTPLEIKLLNGEVSLLQRLDDCIASHLVFMTLAIVYLLLALLVWTLVCIARCKAKGLVKPGPPVIFIQSPAPPRWLEEPPFDPFPPMRGSDYEYERLIDPD